MVSKHQSKASELYDSMILSSANAYKYASAILYGSYLSVGILYNNIREDVTACDRWGHQPSRRKLKAITECNYKDRPPLYDLRFQPGGNTDTNCWLISTSDLKQTTTTVMSSPSPHTVQPTYREIQSYFQKEDKTQPFLEILIISLEKYSVSRLEFITSAMKDEY